jgi:hypothetical protein
MRSSQRHKHAPHHVERKGQDLEDLDDPKQESAMVACGCLLVSFGPQFKKKWRPSSNRIAAEFVGVRVASTSTVVARARISKSWASLHVCTCTVRRWSNRATAGTDGASYWAAVAVLAREKSGMMHSSSCSVTCESLTPPDRVASKVLNDMPCGTRAALQCICLPCL